MPIFALEMIPMPFRTITDIVTAGKGTNKNHKTNKNYIKKYYYG